MERSESQLLISNETLADMVREIHDLKKRLENMQDGFAKTYSILAKHIATFDAHQEPIQTVNSRSWSK